MKKRGEGDFFVYLGYFGLMRVGDNEIYLREF